MFDSPDFAMVMRHASRCWTGRVLGLVAELESQITLEPKTTGKEAASVELDDRAEDGIPSCGDEAANHDGRERSLNLRSARGRQSHRNKAQARHQSLRDFPECIPFAGVISRSRNWRSKRLFNDWVFSSVLIRKRHLEILHPSKPLNGKAHSYHPLSLAV